MMKPVDIRDLKSLGLLAVWVRVPLQAPKSPYEILLPTKPGETYRENRGIDAAGAAVFFE